MIKIRTGYQADQYQIISDEEAHIAYYLFAHPDMRAIFSGGVAIRGQDIIGIDTAINEMMGWNPTYKLDGEDWEQIRENEDYKRTLRRMAIAKSVAAVMRPEDMRLKCSVLAKQHGLLRLGERTYRSNVGIAELLQKVIQ